MIINANIIVVVRFVIIKILRAKMSTVVFKEINIDGNTNIPDCIMVRWWVM